MNRVGERARARASGSAGSCTRRSPPFAPLAEARGDARARAGARTPPRCARSLERDGWDGDWYRRGYFDDGTPLGSRRERRMPDRLDRAVLGVLSGAADPARGGAMAAVDEHLIRRGDGLVLLFTPPFDRTPLDPGYIKGYPPGIRENGGQYTHAAAWSVIAFAALGDGDKAAELFSLLNPINHASTRADVQRYKVEPYVVAADVYSEPPHVGRGGWTLQTGWLYRVGIESILGFTCRALLVSDLLIPTRCGLRYRVSALRHQR